MKRILMALLAMLLAFGCAVAETLPSEGEITQAEQTQSLIPWAEIHFGMPGSCFEALGLVREEELAVIIDGTPVMQSVYVWGVQQIGPVEHVVRCWIGVESCELNEVSCEAIVDSDEAEAAWSAALVLWSNHFGAEVVEHESGEEGMYSAFADVDGVGVMIRMEGSDEFGYVLRTHIWPLP